IELERLCREVHAVGGIRLDAVDAILACAGTGAASDQLTRDEARAVGPLPTERQHKQLAAAVGGHALRKGLPQRGEDGAGDALDGGRARVDGRRLPWIDDGALGQLERDRSEAA